MNFTTWPRLVVVDVEGNGATPPDLVEVAVLPVRDGGPDASTAGAWLIRPPRPVTPFAARVHGLTNELLAKSPAWGEIADQVHSLLSKAWICAHNAHVDYRVLKAHLPQWEPAGVIDTLRLAKATYENLPSYGLDHRGGPGCRRETDHHPARGRGQQKPGRQSNANTHCSPSRITPNRHGNQRE